MPGTGSALEMNFSRGDHTCHFYRSEEERHAVLLACVLQGLQRHEQVVCLLDEPGRQELLRGLNDTECDPQPYLASHQLLLLDGKEAYLPDAQFVPERMLPTLRQMATTALDLGYECVRITGGASWVGENPPGSNLLGEYEAQVTDLLEHDDRFLCLCQFDYHRVPPSLQQQILVTHPLIISGSRLIRNPFFVDVQDFLGPDREAAIMDSWLKSLEARQEAEDALRASEQRYRLVADYTYDWEAWTDPEGHKLYISLSCERITGYTREEFLAQPDLLRSIIHPDDLEAVLEHNRQGMPATDELQIDFRIIRRDGEERWISHYCQAVYSDEGTYLGRRASNRDITARKRAQQEREQLYASVARQRALFQTFFDSAALGIVLANEEGKVERANPAFARMLGYDPEELAGLHVRDFTHPDDLQADLALLTELLAGERDEFALEKRYLRRDGSEVWGRLSVSEVRVSEADRRFLLALVEDVTERKAASAQLGRLAEKAQRRADELETVISSIADGVSICDATGKLVRMNDAAQRLLRYNGEADYRIRTNRCEYYHPDGSVFAFDDLPLTRSLRGETVTGEQVRMAWRDGTSTWVSSTSAPLLDADGHVTGAVLNNTEITALRETQEQVQKERERFFSLLAMLPGYVAVLSPDYHFNYLNQRFIDFFGDPGGENCYRALFNRDEPCENCRSLEPLRSGQPVTWEWEAPSGRFFQVHDHPFTDLDGSPLVLEFGIDITDRKRNQEELRRHRDHLEDLVGHRTQELVEHQEKLRLVAAQLALAEENERKRIATAIHDDLSQTLAFAKLRLSMLRHTDKPQTVPAELQLLEELIGEAIAASRRLMFELSPPILYQVGLVAAIQWLGERARDLHGIDVEVNLVAEDLQLSHEWQVTLYQAMKELLNNAAKHAQATKVVISSSRDNGYLDISVRDNGCGFVPEDVQVTDSSGFGLFTLRERLTHMGGDLVLCSQIHTGSAITIRTPLPN